VLSYQKGCLNSALFSDESIVYLKNTYPERFSVYENTAILKVVLKKDHALLDAGVATIDTGKVVLCTNGFETLTIFNESGLDIDTQFHHDVKGTIGYMSGYLEPMNKPPTAISYFTNPDASTLDPYFYLTRRQYEYEQCSVHSLISVGGPEVSLDDKKSYSRDLLYPESEQKNIDTFIKTICETDPNREIDYKFIWHGLMGYTPNLIRRIGFEPKNKVLMYNLGCNGVGILPSVFGGKRIADLLNGDTSTTIFDPQ
jgi:glycine/D-amino acid oxidase-like deaminating enzyme